MLHPKERKTKFISMLFLIFALILTSVIPIMASEAANSSSTIEQAPEIFYPTELPPIQITSKSRIELKEASILPVQNGNTVTYTLSFVNNENYELPFIDYWARLETKSGTKFTLNLMGDSKETSTKIPPLSSTEVTFYANVGASVELTDLILDMVKFDFSYPDYQKSLGKFQLPANYSSITPEGMIKPIRVSGTPVHTKLETYTFNSSGAYTSNYIELEMNNVGNRKVTLPEYNYYLQTEAEIMYQLEASEPGEKSIQARDSIKISLDVETPNSVDMEQSKLIITMTSNGREIPVAEFELPQASAEEPHEPGSSIGKELEFKNSSGSYGIVLNSVQRLPWEDEDIIAADVTLINRDKKSLPMPSFRGLFELDDVELNDVELKFVSLDRIYGLKANAKTNIMMYIKVPYTFEYEDLQILLQEEDPKSLAVKSLVRFEYEGNSLTLPIIRAGQKHTLDDIGRRAEIDIRTVHTYAEENSDVFYAEIEMKNTEKRPTMMTRLKGYFKTNDDIYFPADVAVITDKMMPNDKALLSLSSELPKGYTMDDLQIVVGQGLNNTTLAIGEEEMGAYMKAVAMDLPDEKVSVTKELRDLEFMPNNMNIRNIRTTLKTIEGDSKGVVSFRYDLTEESPYFVNPKGHSLLMEFEVEDILYSKEFEIGTDLVEGTHDSEMIVDVHSILSKVVGLNEYKLNIYDVYEGHKKLIATKTMNWYVTYD